MNRKPWHIVWFVCRMDQCDIEHAKAKRAAPRFQAALQKIADGNFERASDAVAIATEALEGED